jgi:hypothetical protein
MQGRRVTTKDIMCPALPSKNILNTTLVTQLEVIEDGVVKYFSWDNRCKVYALLEDNQKNLRIIINKKKNK